MDHSRQAERTRLPSGVPDEWRARLEALFRDNHEDLHRLALHVLGSSDQADDVVQRVFLRLLQRDAHGLRINRTYLYRAIWNASLDIRRDENRRRETRIAWGEHRRTFRDSTPNPEKTFRQKRIAAVLADALAELPKSQRVAFELVHLRGAGYKEASESLSISLETFRKRLYRARQGLRIHFKRRGIESPQFF